MRHTGKNQKASTLFDFAPAWRVTDWPNVEGAAVGEALVETFSYVTLDYVKAIYK